MGGTGLGRRLVRHRGALVGLIILGALALMALAAPWLSPRDPIKTAPRAALQPPGATYWLGSDQLGRDVASRVLHGARISLTVGLIAVSIAVSIGPASRTPPGAGRTVRARALRADGSRPRGPAGCRCPGLWTTSAIHRVAPLPPHRPGSVP